MRRLFLYALIGLLLGVGIVALIEVDPGYVLLSYANYTVESSLWVGLLVLTLFTGLIYLTIRLLYKILGGRSSLRGWWGSRRVRQGVHLTNRGLINFIEGNWSKSRRQLLQGTKGNAAPLLNYLFAARASHHLDDPDKMREYLGAAEKSEADATIAVELTQAELKLSAGQYEQALATLVRARRNAGKHPHVLNLLRKAYEGLKDWNSLLELLPELRKYKVLPESELQLLEKRINSQLFQHSLNKPDLEVLHKVWQQLSAAQKKDPDLYHSYLSGLIAAKAFDEAGKLILRSLKTQWDSSLVRLYGLVESPNNAKQLAQAEAWLTEHGKDVQLQLCLGRVSARGKLWGKARDYFENSYKLQRSPEICAELGRLLEALGEPKVSAAYYREGLLMCESALPALPMLDKTAARAPQNRR